MESILHYVEKPARYIGNEINIVIKPETDIELRFGLAFPDVYEIGTSYLGFQILYDLINKIHGVQAERVFAPWPDMERKMRETALPLYGLETKTPLKAFDIIGFTLQYELGYTNILNMLDLAGLPVLAADRDCLPLIIAGGPGAFNPEPLADFIDAFIIGEGEEIVHELIAVSAEGKRKQLKKADVLRKLANIPGVYVPGLYRAAYDDLGRFTGTIPLDSSLPARIKKRIVKNFASLPLPERVVVPLVEPVHDRVSVEICRGCARGCRFCQAGIVYRPVRERSFEIIAEQGQELLKRTGSPELSLSSLSSADYSEIEALVGKMMNMSDVSISLPSLRVDSYSVELAHLTRSVRNTGLTLAPEAGSQRLRDVINKNVRDEDIYSAARKAFENGWETIKLYFMIGLPTETLDDIKGIAEIVFGLERLYREIHGNTRRFKVNLGVSTFVPKAHTPFQWSPQLDREEVEIRQRLLRDRLHSGKFKVQTTAWTDSNLEAVLARGDRRIGAAIYRAWKKGCRFDAWTEHFRPDLWRQAFSETGIDPLALTLKPLAVEQPLPWDHIDIGVSKEFLLKELQRALVGEETPDCTSGMCSVCGICTSYAVSPLKRRGK